MGKKRKWAIVAIVSIMAFIVGALLAHVLLMPRLAEREIRNLARQRGIALDVGKTSMAGVSLKLTDVVACSTDCGPEDPMVVSIGLVKITPDLSSLLRGAPAARAITISQTRARVDLRNPDALPLPTSTVQQPEGVQAGDGEDRESSGSSRPWRIPRIRADSIDLDLQVTDEVTASFSDGAILIEEGRKEATLDLGRTDVQCPSFSVTASHLVVDLAGPEDPGIIRNVRLISPELVFHLPSASTTAGQVDLVPGDQDENGATTAEGEGTEPGGQEEGVWATVHRILDRTDVVGLMTLVPDSLLDAFPTPRLEVNGGSLHVDSPEASSILEASNLKGHVMLDVTNGSISAQMQGDVRQGPFRASVRVDEQAMELEADTPYFPVGEIVKRLPIPPALTLEDARIMMDGKATIQKESALTTFEGVFGGDGITVESKKIALEPVRNVHFRFEGRAELDPETTTFSLTGSRLDASGVPIAIGEAQVTRLQEGYRIRAQGNIPSTRCQDLFNALPFSLRGSLPGFLFEGELGAQFNLDVDWNQVDDAVMDVELDNQCRVVSGGNLELKKFSGTFVHNVSDKVGKHEFVMGPGSESWVNLEEVAEHMPHALVTCEDGAFYKHKGISAFAIKRAVKKNIKKGYFAYGASTITMQLVKNLFLTRDKTISRKLQEMIITWWVENSMEKDQIIELYLNVVEFGPSIYGIKNASMHYFGKHPQDLNLLECAFLAKMLPNPVSRYRYYEKGRGGLDPSWRAVVDRVVGKMFDRGYITREEYDEAMATEFFFYYPDLMTAGEGGTDAEPDEEAKPPLAPGGTYIPAASTSPFPDFSGQ